MSGIRAETITALNHQLTGKSPQEVLTWALREYHPKIGLASSFGAEDVVLIDMLNKINPDARVFTLDTGRLPYETYTLMDDLRERYNLSIEAYFPEAPSVERMVREHGANLFYKAIELRKLCCGVRKVEPLNRALSGLDAWITGLRRDQAVTRSTVQVVEFDQDHGGIAKINPLVDWSASDVWSYIKIHHVPYNALHNQGYPSIGCASCTRAVRPGEDDRAGRWWWENPETKECGLHVSKEPVPLVVERVKA